MISITELSKLFNISVRTIRYYEEIGLIDKAVRIKGKRYFNEEDVIHTMREIGFLKSLNFKLADIGLILENSLYIKPLLLNIRLELVRVEINELNNESARIATQLQYYGWEPLEITDDDILKKMKQNYDELSYVEQSISKKEATTIEDSKKFVKFYKMWHERMGIKLSDDHIKIIAYNPAISLEEKLKNLFQTYCQAIDNDIKSDS